MYYWAGKAKYAVVDCVLRVKFVAPNGRESCHMVLCATCHVSHVPCQPLGWLPSLPSLPLKLSREGRCLCATCHNKHVPFATRNFMLVLAQEAPAPPLPELLS